MMNEIVQQFHDWWREASSDPSLKHKGAVCVSTVDEQGYPNARFVDLKSVTPDGLSFCTFLDSRKGVEMARLPRVALTAWWENVGYQIRVQGDAVAMAHAVALTHWGSRSRDAQLTTICGRQSEPLRSPHELQAQLAAARQAHDAADIPMPSNWGGYVVKPISVEFLTFREDRLHRREHFFRTEGAWSRRLLQP